MAEPSSLSGKEKLVKGTFAVTGIMSTLVIYGLLQEKIMRVPYGPDKELFKYSLFLVFCNRITTSAVSAGSLLASKKDMDPVRSMGIRRLTIFGDSKLVIKQSKGIYQTKELYLLPYHRQVLQMALEFEEISFSHIPRNRNDFADALATLASLIHIPDKENMPNIIIAL